MTKSASDTVRTNVANTTTGSAPATQTTIINQGAPISSQRTNTNQTLSQNRASDNNNLQNPVNNSQQQSQNQATAQSQTTTDKTQPNAMDVDEYSKYSEEDWKEKKNELEKKGFDVSEIEKARLTSDKSSDDDRSAANTGRDKAGKVKGLMDDPDWGKPLDEKFDIQQGDFIEFLMKDVVLASAAWTGNKVCGSLGYVAYKGGSFGYHLVADNLAKFWDKGVAGKKQREKNNKENNEKLNNENLLSGAIKGNDSTCSAIKKVLDIRKDALKGIEDLPEIKEARKLCTLVRSTVRGEMAFDPANPNKLTRTYVDDKGKTQTQSISVDEKTYKQLLTIHNNAETALANAGGDKKELREAMEGNLLFAFEAAADMKVKEKIFATDYAAAVMLEKMARMPVDEIKKIDKSKEFNTLLNGEGKLAFYHHLYDIEHQKEGAFKADKENSALSVMSNTAHKALEESVKKINNSQYIEAYQKNDKTKDKQVPTNATLERIFINGESEYAPNVLSLDEQKQDVALKYMHTDALEGFVRQDRLAKQQENIDRQIDAIAADDKEADKKREKMSKQKAGNQDQYSQETVKRDTSRASQIQQIQSGKTK